MTVVRKPLILLDGTLKTGMMTAVLTENEPLVETTADVPSQILKPFAIVKAKPGWYNKASTSEVSDYVKRRSHILTINTVQWCVREQRRKKWVKAFTGGALGGQIKLCTERAKEEEVQRRWWICGIKGNGRSEGRVVKLPPNSLTWIKKCIAVWFIILYSIILQIVFLLSGAVVSAQTWSQEHICPHLAILLSLRFVWQSCKTAECIKTTSTSAVSISESVPVTDLEQRPLSNSDGTQTSCFYYAFRRMSGLVLWQCTVHGPKLSLLPGTEV